MTDEEVVRLCPHLSELTLCDESDENEDEEQHSPLPPKLCGGHTSRSRHDAGRGDR